MKDMKSVNPVLTLVDEIGGIGDFSTELVPFPSEGEVIRIHKTLIAGIVAID
jgi:hypothetical protein